MALVGRRGLLLAQVAEVHLLSCAAAVAVDGDGGGDHALGVAVRKAVRVHKVHGRSWKEEE